MNEDEKKTLLKKYMEMSEEQLNRMLMKPESEYQEGVFPLLFEAAKSKGLCVNRDEFNETVKRLVTVKQEEEQKVAEQTLSPRQRRLFTIFPGIAFYYSIFTPLGWNQRQKEAFMCQLIGTRNYMMAGLICVLAATIFSNTPVSSNDILLILFISILLCGTLIYLYFKKKKDN